MAIHLYRPQRTPIETLLACNVGRSHFVESVLDDLHARNAGDSRQHFMFIGPRGIGKTTLLRLIAHGITQDPDLVDRYLPVALPEEGYSLSRVSDFMVHMVQILSQDLGRDELADVYDRVRHDDDHQRVVDRVVEAMRGFHRQTGLGVVLMFENAHRFLERQKRNKDELHILRSLMMSETWLTGIFTSPTYLNALVDAKEPFFEFFKVLTLGELTQDELLEVLHKLTEHENNQVFREYLAKHSSRVRALYHFTGGNPRLALMLYELVTKHDIVGVREELDQLLDQITPFYQDRMKDLSEQEAKVIEAMSLIPEGCTPKDLARETRLGGGTTRMVLTRLENAGYVKHEKRSDKKTVYYIQERLFRIWNSMNNSRSARNKHQYIVDFFSSWYSTEQERSDAWTEITKSLLNTNNNKNRTHYLSEYISSLSYVCSNEELVRYATSTIIELLNHKSIDHSASIITNLFKQHIENQEILLHMLIPATPIIVKGSATEILHMYTERYTNSPTGLLLLSVCAHKDSTTKSMSYVEEMVKSITSGINSGSKIFLADIFACISLLDLFDNVIGNPSAKTPISLSKHAITLVFLHATEQHLKHFLESAPQYVPYLLDRNPHLIAVRSYILNSRSPAALEKHAPEVREAALKLVEAFDSNPANSPPGGPGSGS